MTVLDINEIKKILPHRYPMLLVDRILEIEPMKRAVGIKNITANEVQFLGHFPNEPYGSGWRCCYAVPRRKPRQDCCVC